MREEMRIFRLRLDLLGASESNDQMFTVCHSEASLDGPCLTLFGAMARLEMHSKWQPKKCQKASAQWSSVDATCLYPPDSQHNFCS